MDVRLRPFRESDLDLLVRYATDPAFSEPFEWFGFRSLDAFRRRFDEGGFLDADPRYLVVVLDSDEALGFLSWRESIASVQKGVSWDIGILLAPENRGHGIGTAAQRALADYLFDTTPAHRLVAYTESENAAEQHALEKCGFTREGVLREVAYLRGAWRDAFVYAMLREEHARTRRPSGST
jgi:RimJ/RimL family protein N-acetyltransferase